MNETMACVSASVWYRLGSRVVDRVGYRVRARVRDRVWWPVGIRLWESPDE